MTSFKQLIEGNDMINIYKSETADTRTSDWANVSKEQLLASTESHIADVNQGLNYFAKRLRDCAMQHDHDKISDIDGFYGDFKTGFKTQNWYKNHVRVNRHHLTAEGGKPEDVNLVDVLEMIIDGVMAGMARSGSVYDIEISNDILQQAVKNTTEELKSKINVKD